MRTGMGDSVKAAANNSRDFLLRLLPRNTIGAEVGVHKGQFSERILRVVAPSRLHLIDPWQHQPSSVYRLAIYGGLASGQQEMDARYVNVCARFRREIVRGQVVIHRATSGETLESLADNYLDWVYIDGDHTYEHVKSDLEKSLRVVKEGGIISGDDCTDNGWWGEDVVRAVEEFARNDAVRLVMKSRGQFMFRRQ